MGRVCFTPVSYTHLKDALDALVSCYKRTISESQWRKYVQFYAPDGRLRL